jgi:hypothetical protein
VFINMKKLAAALFVVGSTLITTALTACSERQEVDPTTGNCKDCGSYTRAQTW